jgi:UDP-N-acetylglucosamine--N-acetylmuramyl-(pentapeptide) pyrophosphoryl-undecaprenol N-acetylglucosamine transferase
MKDVRAIIAGGGTGGHLFPGIAIAREIAKRFAPTEILFVVGRRRGESEILARYGYAAESIDIEGLQGRGWKKGIGVLIKIPKSFFQSAKIIRTFSPSLVLGVGGYSSGPFCLTARILGVPTAIHEQNSYPGLTNRLLCRFVDRVFISFDESRRFFSTRSVYLTGNPVREEFFQKARAASAEDEGFSILVVGGSQGARAINEVVVEALKCLNKQGKHPSVIHQTGKADYERVLEGYYARGLDGNVVPFIEDMAEAYDRADLVVSRAGATTVFELAAVGKPSILIPYPHAANQHQTSNARALVEVGGARMIHQSDLDPESLAHMFAEYMRHPETLKEMGTRAKKIARSDSASLIVDHLIDFLPQGSE